MRKAPTAIYRGSRARSPRRARARRISIEANPTPILVASPLQASVLVLNRVYVAIHVVGVRRAMGLLVGDSAEVIHLEEFPATSEMVRQTRFANYDFHAWREMSQLRVAAKGPHEDWIKSVNFEIQVPRVIRLLSFDRMPRRQVHLSRRSVFARDGHLCQYCGRHFAAHQLSLDHVLPRSRGGKTIWENIVCSCLKCNIKKGGRTPKEARMKLVQPPRRPKRNPVLAQKLENPSYHAWRIWLDGVHCDLGGRL